MSIEKRSVKFIDGMTVDGCRKPDGEFRVGLEGASLVVGYLKDWLPQAFRRRARTLKALQGLGFTAHQLDVVAWVTS